MVKFGVLLLFVVIGVVIAAYSQFDPFNEICELLPFCDAEEDQETVFLDSQLIWQRIRNRALLDVRKYEEHKNWRARRTTEVFGVGVVDHTMEMRATVNVTMVLNLESVQDSDVIVDNTEKVVTITLPPAQPAECFLEEVEFHNRQCLFEQCGKLEDDLQKRAIEEVLESDGLQAGLDGAFEHAKTVVTEFIEPLIPEDYTLIFQKSDTEPARIESGSCR